MTIPAEEKQRYLDFVHQLTAELGTIRIPPDSTLWHYTTGNSLIEIIKSGTIFATQLSGLNDTTELRYGASLFRSALETLHTKFGLTPEIIAFIEKATEYFKENPRYPAQASNPSFVTCFSAVKNDLSQWRAYGGGENGYAIGFRARTLLGVPQSMIARINYDKDLHQRLAQKSAEKIVTDFVEGTEKYKPEDLSEWTSEFLEAWGRAITMVSPLIKDQHFKAEEECRIVKGFVESDLNDLVFIQKRSMMSRHLPIRPGPSQLIENYKLPIAEIMVGPCRHPEISRTSVNTMLRKYGYDENLVSISNIPFQAT